MRSQVAGLSSLKILVSPRSALAAAMASLMAKKTDAARKRGGSPTACVAWARDTQGVRGDWGGSDKRGWNIEV